MQQTNSTGQATAPPTGGMWLWLGLLVALGGLAGVIVQYSVLRSLLVPWYAAVLATVGTLLIALALFKHMSLARGLILVFVAVLAAFEWYALIVFTQLPAYAGPARQGQTVPAFTAAFADGATFTDRDLRGDGSSVLLFFRGRW